MTNITVARADDVNVTEWNLQIMTTFPDLLTIIINRFAQKVALNDGHSCIVNQS